MMTPLQQAVWKGKLLSAARRVYQAEQELKAAKSELQRVLRIVCGEQRKPS